MDDRRFLNFPIPPKEHPLYPSAIPMFSGTTEEPVGVQMGNDGFPMKTVFAPKFHDKADHFHLGRTGNELAVNDPKPERRIRVAIVVWLSSMSGRRTNAFYSEAL